MPTPVINPIQAFLKAASHGDTATTRRGDFSALVQEPMRQVLSSSREKDRVLKSYIQGDASLMEVTQAVQRSKVDWLAFQKISESMLRALNDLIYKTGL